MTTLTVVESKIGSLLKEAEELSKKDLHDEALVICSAIIEQHPDSFRAYEIRSSIFRRTGDLKRAVEDISHVIRLNPTSAAPLFRRGRYRMAEGHLKGAIEDFSNAMTLDSGYFGDALRLYRAEAFLRSGRYAKAISDCEAMSTNYGERNFFGHEHRSRADIDADARAGWFRKGSSKPR